jgi:hypothetical protein
MASTTCMFNLAMAWHHLGSLTGYEEHAVKAGKLYDLILCILDHTECGHREDKSYVVVACLVLNNRAQLFYVHGYYANCRSCTQEMYSLLPEADCSHEALLGENTAMQLSSI